MSVVYRVRTIRPTYKNVLLIINEKQILILFDTNVFLRFHKRTHTHFDLTRSMEHELFSSSERGL